MTGTYDPTTALAALDSAAQTLTAAASSATTGNAPRIAELLNDTATLLTARRNGLVGAINTGAFTLTRARTILAAAGVAYVDNGGELTVMLPVGSLGIMPWSALDPSSPGAGWGIAIRGEDGMTATRLKAPTDALLGQMAKLYAGAAA